MFFLLCLGLCQTAFAAALALDPFESVKVRYFKMLNLRSGQVQIKKMPQFAAELSVLADKERLKLKAGKLISKEERARAGLIFSYDGLMTLVYANGVQEGKLSIDKLRTAKRYGAIGSNDADELLARFQYAIDSLKSAFLLRPDDMRVKSWLTIANAGLDQAKNQGHFSRETLLSSLDEIPVRPVFFLLDSILFFKDQNPGTAMYERLTSASKEFVHDLSTSSGKDKHCSELRTLCVNSILGPYNVQTVAVRISDVFVRRAEYLLVQGERKRAMELVDLAEKTLAHLELPEFKADTDTWPNLPALKERLRWVKVMHQMPKLRGSLSELKGYQRVYECTSCHGK